MVELVLSDVVVIKVLGGVTERFVRFAPGPTKYPWTIFHPLGRPLDAGDPVSDPLNTLLSTALVKLVPATFAPVRVAPFRFALERLRFDKFVFDKLTPGPTKNPPIKLHPELVGYEGAVVALRLEPFIPETLAPERFVPLRLTDEKTAFVNVVFDKFALDRFTYVSEAFFRVAPERLTLERFSGEVLVPAKVRPAIETF